MIHSLSLTHLPSDGRLYSRMYTRRSHSMSGESGEVGDVADVGENGFLSATGREGLDVEDDEEDEDELALLCLAVVRVEICRSWADEAALV